MNPFRKLFQRYSNRQHPADKPGGDHHDPAHEGNRHTTAVSLRQREREIYGEDLLAQQRLYERWVCRESWRLREEALPLFLGIDPERLETAVTGPGFEKEQQTLWIHARQCVEQGLLEVTNRESEPEEWEVRPLTAYRWAAISRVELPETLATLMEFISSTVKRHDAPLTPPGRDSNDASVRSQQFDSDREKILGMALAILAAFPDQTRNSKGRVNINRLMRIMGEKKDFWLGDEPLSMSDPAIRDLLNKWLATLP